MYCPARATHSKLNWRRHMKLEFPSNSRYLTKEDIGEAKNWTLDIVERQSMQNGDRKFVLYFIEHEKPLVLNRTNFTVLDMLYGNETDDWKGKPICVYFDPSVMYGTERTGGIRLRAVTGRARPAASPDRGADLDDDIPF